MKVKNPNEIKRYHEILERKHPEFLGVVSTKIEPAPIARGKVLEVAGAWAWNRVLLHIQG